MMNLGQIKEGAGTRPHDAPFYPIAPARWHRERPPVGADFQAICNKWRVQRKDAAALHQLSAAMG
jgi:hypothetical protein